MPDDDSLLGQNLVDVRNEERMRTDVWICADPEQDWIDDQRDAARDERRRQLPACDRCTQGVMDATNTHYLGLCTCACHTAA